MSEKIELPDEIKIALYGDQFVGKTALLVAYATNRFQGIYEPTIFDHSSVKLSINGQMQTLLTYDTSGDPLSVGQQTSDGFSPFPLKADVFLLCFSLVSESSYLNAKTLWSERLRKRYPDRPILLVGTKLDLRDNYKERSSSSDSVSSTVSHRRGSKLAKKIGAFDYVECSALTLKNVKQVFDEAIQIVLRQTNKNLNSISGKLKVDDDRKALPPFMIC